MDAVRHIILTDTDQKEALGEFWRNPDGSCTFSATNVVGPLFAGRAEGAMVSLRKTIDTLRQKELRRHQKFFLFLFKRMIIDKRTPRITLAEPAEGLDQDDSQRAWTWHDGRVILAETRHSLLMHAQDTDAMTNDEVLWHFILKGGRLRAERTAEAHERLLADIDHHLRRN